MTERSADIEGLSEMIASFADGSEESVNAIAGMAGATDEQLATMVANWQTLQTEQEAAAGSVADLKTDFTATMDELQAELAADIEAMDLGAEAAASGKATIQGFVSGAEGMLPQVQAAYSRIAQAAIDAIDAKLEIHSPSRVMEEKADMTWAGYIKETEALQPDVAEAMSGMAGAGVEAFSAEEIQAVGIAPQLMAYLASYQTSNAISAESGAGRRRRLHRDLLRAPVRPCRRHQCRRAGGHPGGPRRGYARADPGGLAGGRRRRSEEGLHMRTYTTTQGDMWDSIAFQQMGSVDYTDQLMNANQQYREYYTFPAGIVLTIPDAVESVSSSLPPWKQVAG